MSARIMTRRPGLAPRRTATAPVSVGTRRQFPPEFDESIADDLGRAVLLKREFGMGVEVVAKLDHGLFDVVEELREDRRRTYRS